MAIENIEATFEVVNKNTLSITPTETIQDNSTYTIKISGLKSANKEKLLPTTQIKITTAISPAYCTLSSLKALVNTFNIPETDLLSYIRDASNYADFISGSSVSSSTNSSTTSFAKEQFTRTKATLDCLLRGTIEKAYSSGNKYTLDVATLEDSTNAEAFSNLIDLLKDELTKWQDAIRGYYNEGRVAPTATRISLKSTTNSEVSDTTVDKILNDFTRTMPGRND